MAQNPDLKSLFDQQSGKGKETEITAQGPGDSLLDDSDQLDLDSFDVGDLGDVDEYSGLPGDDVYASSKRKGQDMADDKDKEKQLSLDGLDEDDEDEGKKEGKKCSAADDDDDDDLDEDDEDEDEGKKEGKKRGAADDDDDLDEDDEDEDEDEDEGKKEGKKRGAADDDDDDDLDEDDEDEDEGKKEGKKRGASDDDDDLDEDEDDEDEDKGKKEGKKQKKAAAWVEENVVAAMLESSLNGVSVGTKREAVASLRDAHRHEGASFIRSMSNRDFSRLTALMEPIVEGSKRIVEKLEASDSRAKDMVSKLRKANKENEAEKVEQEYAEARMAEVEESDLSFECPAWLTASINDFLTAADDDDNDKDEDEKKADDDEDDEKGEDVKASVDLPTEESPANEIVASLACALVENKRSRKAAKVITGYVNNDTVEAAKVCATLYKQGQLSEASSMVEELRQAMYPNPDQKPIDLDPTRPTLPSATDRLLGPPPDFGATYGSDDAGQEAVKELNTDPSTLVSWVAEIPVAGDSLDKHGVFACYTKTAGKGPTKEMNLDEAREYVASKTVKRAVLLANPNDFGAVNADDVVMVLHAAAEPDPYWSVSVQGMPVAEIRLSDQEKAENIRATFVNPDVYGQGVRESIASFGVKPTLDRLNSRYYAAAYVHDQEVERSRNEIAAKAETEINAKVQEKVREFLDLMLLAHEGFSRNVYPKDNPLKWALRERIVQAGVANPDVVIEEGLNYLVTPENASEGVKPKTAMAMYLEAIADQALEYGKMEPAALEQITSFILDAPVRLREGSAQIQESMTLKEKLATASVPFVSVPDVPYNAGTEEPANTAVKDNLQIGRRWDR